MAARRIEGQAHDLPQPSREPTGAFDDYIFVVEAFEGTEPWNTRVGGAGSMSMARSLGVARALPVFCGDTVKLRAEFQDEVFAMHVHGFIRVLVARKSIPDKVALFYEGVAHDFEYHEGDEHGDIKWAAFCERPVFDIVADDQAMHIRMNRGMAATVRALDAPVVEPQYYANRTGPAYPDEGMDYSTKSTGSSIELSFCDSKARRTIIDAYAPTAAEVLFRLEHFLVFE